MEPRGLISRASVQGPGLVPHVDYYTHLLWRQLAVGAVIDMGLTVLNGTLITNNPGVAAAGNVSVLTMCGGNDGNTTVRPARTWVVPAPDRARVCLQGGVILAYTNVYQEPVALAFPDWVAGPYTQWVLSSEPVNETTVYSGVGGVRSAHALACAT